MALLLFPSLLFFNISNSIHSLQVLGLRILYGLLKTSYFKAPHSSLLSKLLTGYDRWYINKIKYQYFNHSCKCRHLFPDSVLLFVLM